MGLRSLWLVHDDAVLVGEIADNFDREPIGLHVKMQDGSVVFVPWHNIGVVSDPPEGGGEHDELLKGDSLPVA